MSPSRQRRGTGDGDLSRDFFVQGAAAGPTVRDAARACDRPLDFRPMAAWFIVIVLIGFIPDAVMKVQRCRPGTAAVPADPARPCGADGVVPAAASGADA